MLLHIITAAIVLGGMIYSIDWVLRNKTEALGEEKARVGSAGGLEQSQTRALGNNANTQGEASQPHPRGEA